MLIGVRVCFSFSEETSNNPSLAPKRAKTKASPKKQHPKSHPLMPMNTDDEDIAMRDIPPAPSISDPDPSPTRRNPSRKRNPPDPFPKTVSSVSGVVSDDAKKRKRAEQATAGDEDEPGPSAPTAGRE